MFKSMRLKNFKAYKDSGEVPLAPLTVIVGANNSGKSTLFHGMLALTQTVLGQDHGWGPQLVTKGRLVDLNGYWDITHQRKQIKHQPIQMSFTLDAKASAPRTVTENGRKPLARFVAPLTADISFALEEKLGAILVNAATLRTGGQIMISAERKRDHWSLLLPQLDGMADDDVAFRTVFPCLNLPRSESLTRDVLKAVHVSQFSADIWTDVFARLVSHVGPLRIRVPWHASIGARIGSEFGLGGETLLAALGSEEKHRSTGKTLIEHVNDWLGRRESLSCVRLVVQKTLTGQALVGVENAGQDRATSVNVAAMGEGISQILPIVARTMWGEPDECLLVEQPEIHVHPALQSELGDLFIDAAQSGQKQILVETHSEHLVLRVRRRIAEGKLTPEQVAILFVEKHHGESTVRCLDVNSRGHFSNWPPGFFDEAYQEAMALAAASSKKG